jgi:hypothetical protein
MFHLVGKFCFNFKQLNFVAFVIHFQQHNPRGRMNGWSTINDTFPKGLKNIFFEGLKVLGRESMVISPYLGLSHIPHDFVARRWWGKKRHMSSREKSTLLPTLNKVHSSCRSPLENEEAMLVLLIPC